MPICVNESNEKESEKINMKSILLSIRPEWFVKILNGDKLYEIRSMFPKDYVGGIYLYCTKGKPYLFKDIFAEKSGNGELYYVDNKEHDSWSQKLNGKVVARFWCDKVQILKHFTETERIKDEEEYCFDYWADKPLPLGDMSIQPKSCISNKELMAYAKGKKELLAISITKLEIFDKPKELGEFKKEFACFNCHCDREYCFYTGATKNCENRKLTKAPQNYCYVEE